MKNGLKTVLLTILLLVAVPLLIVTLADVFDFGITTADNHPKYSSEEIYQGIKNSFDDRVVPAMEEGFKILEQGLENIDGVFNEFSK